MRLPPVSICAIRDVRVSGTKLANRSGMSTSSRNSYVRSARLPSGSRLPRSWLVFGAVLLVLAMVAAGAARGSEPPRSAPPARAPSSSSGAVQVLAVSTVLVHPVPASAIVARTLTPQSARAAGGAELVERPTTGLGSMLLSMMAIVGWIALRRR